MFKILSFVIVMAGLFAMQPAFAEEAKLLRSISLSGHGEVRAVPDVAQISIGVTSSGLTAREALTSNTSAMKALMALLGTSGIDGKDIATSNFSVGPRYDYGQNGATPPKIVGYDVNNMVTVVVRKLDSLGAVLDAAVTAGSNQIQGISFSISKPDAMLDEARKDALADARHNDTVNRLGSSVGVSRHLPECLIVGPPLAGLARF